MCPRIGPLITFFGRAALKVARTDWGEAKWVTTAQKKLQRIQLGLRYVGLDAGRRHF
jgi:hypothetical protein